MDPSAAAFELTTTPLDVEFVAIDNCPVELMVAVVPDDSVPAETALATALCKVAMVSPAAALKVMVSPVEASLMLVTEPVAAPIPDGCPRTRI